MYLVRRIFNTKPGEARKVASLVQKQAQIYHDAGQRSEFRVYFNGGTVPGENNVVVLEWTDEALMSPMRGDTRSRPRCTKWARRSGSLRPATALSSWSS